MSGSTLEGGVSPRGVSKSREPPVSSENSAMSARWLTWRQGVTVLASYENLDPFSEAVDRADVVISRGARRRVVGVRRS